LLLQAIQQASGCISSLLLQASYRWLKIHKLLSCMQDSSMDHRTMQDKVSHAWPAVVRLRADIRHALHITYNAANNAADLKHNQRA
jgi:hypothetical protein